MQCTAWLGQCILYILIMMFEKVLIMLVLLIPEWKKVRGAHFSKDLIRLKLEVVHIIPANLFTVCSTLTLTYLRCSHPL